MKNEEYATIAGIAFVMALLAIALMTRGKLPKYVTNIQPRAAA